MSAQQTAITATMATQVLSSITSALVGHSEMDSLLDQVVKSTMETLYADVCSIFLLEREGDKDILVMRAGSGFAEKLKGIARYEVGQAFTGYIATTETGLKIDSRKQLENLTIDGRRIWQGNYDKNQWPSGRSEFRNLIALPLKIKGQCLGVIKVENKHTQYGDKFSEDDRLYFETIANVVALAIESARLAQQKITGATQVLSSIISALVGYFDMGRLLDQVVKSTMKTLHADVCSIFLLEREGDKDILVMRAGSGFAEKLVKIAKYEIGQGFTGYIATTETGLKIDSRQQLENLTINGKRIWQGNYDKNQWPSGRSEFRNLIALPLRIKGQCLGVIKVENKHAQYGDKFSEDDRLYFETIANVVALAIENAKLHEQTEKQRKAIAAKAAHRIHNQATNFDDIEMAIDAELQEVDPRHRERFNHIVSRLNQTTINLKRMTEEFKNYGKPLKLDKTIVDLNQIIETEVGHAQLPKEVKIDMAFDPNLPKVNIDAPRFAEAVKELLRNSIKAISKGKNASAGRIRVSTHFITNKRIISGTGQYLPDVAGMVQVKIEDNGPGFSEALAVFEPFYSTDPNSTGLGLATVKELIEAHGGTIKALPGQGATIEMEVPIA